MERAIDKMNEPSTTSETTSPALTVLYDGACPLCRREIALYRGTCGDVPLRFADVSNEAVVLPPSLTRDTALARFHVQRADGQIVSGAQAFLALWSVLPRWRWLARIGRVPGVAPLLEHMYRGFLVFRPAMQRLAERWDKRA
jgi:predicted DCC family thiol-disulfide oxidoreductase YuxK